MTKQDPADGDKRIARLIQVARELIDAYQTKSTANPLSEARGRG
jgi:hypothetical protein